MRQVKNNFTLLYLSTVFSIVATGVFFAQRFKTLQHLLFPRFRNLRVLFVKNPYLIIVLIKMHLKRDRNALKMLIFAIFN